MKQAALPYNHAHILIIPDTGQDISLETMLFLSGGILESFHFAKVKDDKLLTRIFLYGKDTNTIRENKVSGRDRDGIL